MRPPNRKRAGLRHGQGQSAARGVEPKAQRRPISSEEGGGAQPAATEAAMMATRITRVRTRQAAIMRRFWGIEEGLWGINEGLWGH